MKCKPLSIGLNISGNEVLYPIKSRTNDPSILNHYISKGYNLFRLLIRWERLQPSLSTYLTKGTIPPVNIPLDQNYLNIILSYIDVCVKNKVQCVIQIDNGYWYDVSYDNTFINDGTKNCPNSNYVYVDQTSYSTFNQIQYKGPSSYQLSNLIINLASTLYNGYTLKNNPYVRFGLGQNSSLSTDSIIKIANTVISNIRSVGVNNVIYYDFNSSGYIDTSKMDNIIDSENKSILNVNLMTNTDIIIPILINNQNDNCENKVSIGDIRFTQTNKSDVGTIISYLTNNISTFESVSFFGIGDSNRLSGYDLNYTKDISGNIIDNSNLDVINNLPSYNDINSSILLKSITTPLYTLDNPFNNTSYSLTSPSYLDYSILNSKNDYTIELWAKNIFTGNIISANTLLSITSDTSNIVFKFGNLSYVNVLTPNIYNDGKWHHYEIDVNGDTIVFFIDGKVIGKTIVKEGLDPDYTKRLGFLSDSNSLDTSTSGIISNITIWNKAKHTSSFDLPTSYYTGTEDGLLINFRLDSNLVGVINQ